MSILDDVDHALSARLGVIRLAEFQVRKDVFKASNPVPIDSSLKGAPRGGAFDSEIVQTLVFDAMLNSTHKSSATVTRHPVETGADIADHIQINPDSLTLSLVVTNSPLKVPFGQTSDPERANKAHQQLIDMKNARVVVDVLTSWRPYKSMAITEVSHTRDVNTAGMASLSVTLEEIRTANSQSIDAPTVAAPRAEAVVAKGKVATPVATPAETTIGHDLASPVIDAVSEGTFHLGAP